MTDRLRADYACVSVPYEFGAETRYDAAIRLGLEIVWQEGRSLEALCLHPGSATTRARKVLAAVERWLAEGRELDPLDVAEGARELSWRHPEARGGRS